VTYFSKMSEVGESSNDRFEVGIEAVGSTRGQEAAA
jgi:hypothetical protein